MAQLTRQAIKAREYIFDSLNKHTPGPWYTRHGQISSIASTHGCTIANCNSTSKGISDDETAANAALIAAAPALLRLCEQLTLMVETMDNDLTAMGKGRHLSSVPGFEGANIIDTAKAIITQARGEA